MSVQVTNLRNGMRVATDYMSTVETASVGAWVSVGTRHEEPELNGISHLLEHLAFKGTKKRTAFSIAEEIEAVGGQLNAYTSRENTAYYAKVLKEDVALAIDIISDILQYSTIKSCELERECEVVIQEIHQSYDTPDDIIFDHFHETAYPNQAVGRPVLGNANLIKNIDRDTLLDYMRTQYSASKIVIAGAGNVEHDYLVELSQRAFSNLHRDLSCTNEQIRYKGGDYREIRDLEQAHIVMGLDGVSYKDPDYYTMSVLSTLLGGGMSSRLFQEVREKRGLVYSVYSFISNFEDGGIFGIYAGSGQNEVRELLPIICCEIQKLTDNISDGEIDRARCQLKSSTLMALESTASRSEQIARQLQIFNRIIPVKEVIERIEEVSATDLKCAAQRLLDSKLTFTALGAIQNIESFDAISNRLS